jgi:hypothetical protein
MGRAREQSATGFDAVFSTRRHDQIEYSHRHTNAHLSDREKLKLAFAALRRQGIAARIINVEHSHNFNPKGHYVFTNSHGSEFNSAGQLIHALYLSHSGKEDLEGASRVPAQTVMDLQAAGLSARYAGDSKLSIVVERNHYQS